MTRCPRIKPDGSPVSASSWKSPADPGLVKRAIERAGEHGMEVIPV